MLITEASSYIELLQNFPPRPIKSETELLSVQSVIDTLIDAREMTSEQRDYLNLLGILVHEYEEKHVPIPDLSGVALLKALMEENGVEEKELVPIFKTESMASAVLREHHGLTVEHIEKLSSLFKVPPSIFLTQTS